MARSRNIKPGFFTNDELAEIEPLGRLLFAGLWTIADREGRLEDRPKRIKAEILPYDDCDVDYLLQQLHDRNFILRYEVNGKRYIQVVNFKKHQNPHVKEPPSTIPAPDLHHTSTVQAPEENRTDPADSLNLIPDPDPDQDPDQDPPLPPQGDESSASVTPATRPGLSELLARYNPEQKKVIHEYFDMLRFTRKTGRIAKNIMLRELSYWGRYPPEIVIEALSIHTQRYPTKREDYTRGIIRRIYREKGGQNGTDWKQNTGTYPGDPGPTTESQRLEQLAREKGLIKDGEIHDIDCPF